MGRNNSWSAAGKHPKLQIVLNISPLKLEDFCPAALLVSLLLIIIIIIYLFIYYYYYYYYYYYSFITQTGSTSTHTKYIQKYRDT